MQRKDGVRPLEKMKRRISSVRIVIGTVLLVLAMCLFVAAYATKAEEV